MDLRELEKIIEKGESRNLEFKSLQNLSTKLKSIYETICAFQNTDGGKILIGVEDDGTIIGLNKIHKNEILNKLSSDCKNVLNPPLSLVNYNEISLDNGRYVICLNISPTGKLSTYNAKYYLRSHENDIDITNDQDELFHLMSIRHNKNYFLEQVYPEFGMEILDSETIALARQLALVDGKDIRSWSNFSDEELLRSLKMIRRDRLSKKEGLTAAAILLFGKDPTIICPSYRTDAIVRINDVDRYDDREVIKDNLISSYFRLMEFGKKHLSDSFFLDGIIRVSLRNKILREIISNTLIHRDYSSNYIAKFVIEKDQIIVENASTPCYDRDVIDGVKFQAITKNPIISGFFKDIQLTDELGSGFRNLKKYTKIYSNAVPHFTDEISTRIFKTIIPLLPVATIRTGFSSTTDSNNDLQIINLIVDAIKQNNQITRSELARIIGVKSLKTVQNYLNKVPKLKFVGRGKNGHWEF